MTARIYYHGTRTLFAYSIMRQGFRIGQEAHGRNLGNGLYLTARIGFAGVWGPIIIRCRLKKGTRILWHTRVDMRTIRYLKKEFGAGITRPNFDTVIPNNKQLTRTQVADLWNYLLTRHYLKVRPARRDSFFKLVENYPFIYKHLKRHGYDGVGMLDAGWPEMLLFNPSNAIPLSAHTFTMTGWRSDWEMENVELELPLSSTRLRELQELER